MLKVTNDGRQLALDQRLIDPMLPDDPNSKVNACVDNIYRIWEEHADTKAAQLVFSDLCFMDETHLLRRDSTGYELLSDVVINIKSSTWSKGLVVWNVRAICFPKWKFTAM